MRTLDRVAKKTDKQPVLPTKIDWDEAERMYVLDASRPSVAEVGRRFGVANPTVYIHSNRRHWDRKRLEHWRQVHLEALHRGREEAILALHARWRSLRGLVESAIAAATASPTPDNTGHLLRLVQVEREVMDGLPKDQSREAALREHVEQALGLAGLPPPEDHT